MQAPCRFSRNMAEPCQVAVQAQLRALQSAAMQGNSHEPLQHAGLSKGEIICTLRCLQSKRHAKEDCPGTEKYHKTVMPKRIFAARSSIIEESVLTFLSLGWGPDTLTCSMGCTECTPGCYHSTNIITFNLCGYVPPSSLCSMHISQMLFVQNHSSNPAEGRG